MIRTSQPGRPQGTLQVLSNATDIGAAIGSLYDTDTQNKVQPDLKRHDRFLIRQQVKCSRGVATGAVLARVSGVFEARWRVHG